MTTPGTIQSKLTTDKAANTQRNTIAFDSLHLLTAHLHIMCRYCGPFSPSNEDNADMALMSGPHSLVASGVCNRAQYISDAFELEIIWAKKWTWSPFRQSTLASSLRLRLRHSPFGPR
ncbi:hypothetical protein AcV7_007725 [Taiwanofungus camphoratus]|nr:hypothetical protein AcV7_007725 [Antrodia cinnamomea]